MTTPHISHQPVVKRRISSAAKLVAWIFSVATAAVTVFTFARSYGLIGAPAPAALTVGALRVSWVSLSPAVDTATAIGDTVRLAATVTDDNGTALVGATIHWSSDDSSVAEALPAGRIVARRPGETTIVATVGDRLARARVVVRQRVATVRLNGDSTLIVGEDERRQVPLLTLDPRGIPVRSRRASWSSADTTIATVDSLGTLVARAQGRTVVTAEVDGSSAEVPVSIVARAATLEAIAGSGQRAMAGASLPERIAVRVLSSHGKPISGVSVTFRVADARGRTEPTTAVTDEQGVARTSWTLAPVPGRQRLLASTDRLDSVAVVVAESDPLASNTRVVALRTGLSGRIGEPLADTAGVRLTDAAGRALPDVPVSWSADDRGMIAPIGDRTDSLGEARALWTLGPGAGVQHVRVRVGSGRSVPPFTMGALAVAGAASSLRVVSGNDQRARAGAPLAKAVVIEARDLAGNAVAGASLALRPSTGAIEDSTPTTDSAGRVRVRWTMPTKAGVAKLTARLAGARTGVDAQATVLPGAPANVTFDQPRGGAVAGHALAKPVVATVTDVHGNPVSGVVVTFHASSGTVAPARVATDEHGVAKTHWTLGKREGDQTLTAAGAGVVTKGSVTVEARHRR